MPPLRTWMKFALSAMGTINVLVGAMMVGFYHEGSKLLNVPKPQPTWALQAVGAVTLLLGVGYWLVLRRPLRFRGVAAIGFLIHVVASFAIVWAVSAGQLKLGLLVIVFLTALFYLVPLALILRRLYSLSPAGALASAPESLAAAPAWPRRTAAIRQSITAAMVLTIVLPSSWGVAYALSDIRSRRELRDRPAKWTPLAVNLPKSVGEEYPFAMVDAFGELRFVDPTFVAEIPDGSGRMVVVERRGKVTAINKHAGPGQQPTTLLDITDRTLNVPGKAEDGLLCLAFHPQYADANSPHQGEVFVRYTSMADGKRSNRLSKFKLASNGGTVDPASETILIEMPEKTAVHKGGGIAFGPDGFLYATFGTDGRHFPHDHAQRIDHGLWAGVLRIDPDCRGGEVSHPPPRPPKVGKVGGYFIPSDNPFVGEPGVLEEFYSLGFRNPWRLSIDKQTGLVWVGDVGDHRREEINIATSGSNHQFDYREGTLTTRDYQPLAPLKPEKIIGHEAPPLYEYERDGTNRCVIGGYVYRGQRFPDLVGKYVYGDQCGRIYAITVDHENNFVGNELIAVVRAAGLGVSSLGEDADGELYVCWIGDTGFGGGQIFRFERGQEDAQQRLPTLLSATGLFTDLKSLTPNPALIDYDVNTPLWSDRAVKRRWVGLVSHEKVRGELEGRWQFPEGTVFVKHFDLPLDESSGQESGVRGQESTGEDASSPEVKKAGTTRRLETRILVRDDLGGVYGATYRWNKEQSEAYLVNFAETENIDYIDAHGEKQTQAWTYPGRFDCLACHNQVAGGVLGFTARQLNRDVHNHGIQENQLVKFAQAGMFNFDCRPEDTQRVVTLSPLSDQTASVETRVRSYLDSNCSHCHQPGNRYGQWDARFSTPLDYQKIVDGVAFNHRGDNPRSRIIRPGDLDFSFLYVRLSSNDRFLRMPPMARTVVHEDAVKLVAQWVKSLPLLVEDAQRAKPKNLKPAEEEDNEYIGSTESDATRR